MNALDHINKPTAEISQSIKSMQPLIEKRHELSEIQYGKKRQISTAQGQRFLQSKVGMLRQSVRCKGCQELERLNME